MGHGTPPCPDQIKPKDTRTIAQVLKHGVRKRASSCGRSRYFSLVKDLQPHMSPKPSL
jgi:hypothetical protein